MSVTDKFGRIYIYDQETGETNLVSIGMNGSSTGHIMPSLDISADGRFVSFTATADDIVAEDTNGQGDIFVYDRQTGETVLASVSPDGKQSWGPTVNGVFSKDGRYIAFHSEASVFVVGDTNNKLDVFVREQESGEITRISINTHGEQGNDDSYHPSVSGDGRFIAFESWATNLVDEDLTEPRNIFVHDRQTGEVLLVSMAADGSQANDPSVIPSISADGRYVVFASAARNLVDDDTNKQGDVFVHDLETGQTQIVSIADDGTQSNGRHYSWDISDNGRFVVFSSESSTLIPNDTNNEEDIFVYDLQTP